jgi:linoleoyl-CoA desaturase
MKTLKFISTDPQQHQFAVALRKNVNDYFTTNGLSKKGNTALVIQALIMVSIYLVPFIVVLAIPVNAWVALLLVILMGIGLAGTGMCVMHDGVHGACSTNEWVNKLFGGTILLLGSNLITWKIQHNVLHHTYTNVEGYDEDIASRGPIRLSENAPLRKIHRYQYIHAFFFYGLMTISKLTRDFTQLAAYNKSGMTRQHHVHPVREYVEMVLMKIIYLLLSIGLPLWLTEFTWWQVLLGFFIMHWVAGCILSTVFQMAHVVEGSSQPMPDAEGVVKTDWALHQLQTTSDFARNNLFLNWYVGGLNFQIEHHLFPAICHVHYPKIAPIVERTAKEFGYTYNLKPTFRMAFASHVRRLKELGTAAKASG